MSSNCDHGGNENVTEKSSQFSYSWQSSESKHISCNNSKGILSSFTETYTSNNCFDVSMSTDVLNDSFKAKSAALEAAYNPADPWRNSSFFLSFFNLFVDISKDDLDGPDNGKE